jgi:hypothetical protein
MGCWSVAGCGGQCARVATGRDRAVHQRPLTLPEPCRSKVTGTPNASASERGAGAYRSLVDAPRLEAINSSDAQC